MMISAEKAPPKPRELTQFDARLLPNAYGLHNGSGICWFNSMVQALLSCTQLQALPDGVSSRLEKSFYAMLTTKSDGDAARDALLKAFLEKAQDFAGVGLEYAPSCVDEALTVLLSLLPEAERLFALGYDRTIRCSKCGYFVTSRDVGIMTHLETPLHGASQSASFRDKIAMSRQNGCTDWRCEKCGAMQSARLDVVRRLSEILVVSCHGNAPDETLAFRGKQGRSVEYALVACIMYTGGHYYSIARRQEGPMRSLYILNDAGVQPVASWNEALSAMTPHMAFYSHVALH